jgi:hypothetical protein
MSFQQFINHYRTILLTNLEDYPAFDPTSPYPEKNAYFEKISSETANLFGYDGLVPDAEQFYRTMVDTIVEYEKQHGKIFNKGIVYANLGIVLISHDNIDEGIHFLLLADKEDSLYQHNPHDILNGILWKQFEDRRIIPHLLQLNANPDASLHFPIDEAFILNFLTSLELPDRLLLETTLWMIYRNIEFNQVNSNDYTRGKLYSGLKDLCLLTESLLRKKQRLQGIVNPTAQVTLGTLFNNVLPGLGVGYPHIGLPMGANSLQDFVNKVEHILITAPSPEIRRIYCLHIVRNFTGHHFDVSSHIRTPNGHEFFDLYSATLTNTVATIFYLAQTSLI